MQAFRKPHSNLIEKHIELPLFLKQMQKLKQDSEGFNCFGIFLTFEFSKKEYFGAECGQTPMESHWIWESFPSSRFLLLQTVHIVKAWHRMKRITDINSPLWISSAYPFLCHKNYFDSNTNGLVACNLRCWETPLEALEELSRWAEGGSSVSPLSEQRVSCANFSVCFL